jgi:hypothetical protein
VALLAPAANAAAAEVARIAAGVYLGRDLINAPANDLGPAELEAAAEALAKAPGGTFSSIVGDALLSAPGGGYPLIHAVGRAATPERAPRLLDLRALGSSLPVPPQRKPGAPVLVAGAALDAVVDAQGVRETAAAWGTSPVVLQGLAHDVMLDARWEEAAQTILAWLDKLPATRA